MVVDCGQKLLAVGRCKLDLAQLTSTAELLKVRHSGLGLMNGSASGPSDKGLWGSCEYSV